MPYLQQHTSLQILELSGSNLPRNRDQFDRALEDIMMCLRTLRSTYLTDLVIRVPRQVPWLRADYTWAAVTDMLQYTVLKDIVDLRIHVTIDTWEQPFFRHRKHSPDDLADVERDIQELVSVVHKKTTVFCELDTEREHRPWEAVLS